MHRNLILMGVRFRPRFWGACGALMTSLVLGSAAQPALADDTFQVKDSAILGNFDLLAAELPPGITTDALVPDPLNQDIVVLGSVIGSSTGASPTPVAMRFGRTSGRSEMRLVVGPRELFPTTTTFSGLALRGGLAKSAAGTVLAVSQGSDSKLYFYDVKTHAATVVGSLGTSLALVDKALTPAINKVGSMIGLGTKIYAADVTNPVVAQLDLMTGNAVACKVDGVVSALRINNNKVEALTDKGVASLPDPCTAATIASVTGKPPVTPATTLTMTPRGFELSDRVIEMTFPTGATAATTARGGVTVTLAGAASANIAVSAGTCKRTQFLGNFGADTYSSVKAPTALPGGAIALSSLVNRMALFAQQTAPGEDCVAVLSSTGGDALLRVRGSVEGFGANVVMMDRSFSMERSLRGIGAATSADDARVAAMRQSLASILGMVTTSKANGPWSFLPFTDKIETNIATPTTGYSRLPELSNPDHPNGLRVKGFATAAGDTLDPGGPSDLVSALRSAGVRLDYADAMLPVDTYGYQRRVWILSDGISGKKSYGDYQGILASLMRRGASLQLLGVGSLDNDPVLQQLMAQSYLLGGELPYGPARGQFSIARNYIGMIESTANAVVRQALRGRPMGVIGRGDVQGMTKTLGVSFDLAKADPWVLFVAAWEPGDATMALKITQNGLTVTAPCTRATHSIVCALPGVAGNYSATLSGDRPGGGTIQAVLRAYSGSAGGLGEVGYFSSFGRSLYRSGDKVRVQIRLNERGLPLRSAKVTAKVTGPNGAAGSVLALAKTVQSDISALIAANGDLSPAQAKAELVDPTTLPSIKPIGNITLVDDSTNGDLETGDGVYTGEFSAFLPGVYTVDLHADYSGLFGSTGAIEDRVSTTVVVGLDQKLTAATVRSEPLSSGGIRIRFIPQDSGKNLLGPGQGASLQFAQGTKLLAPTIGDYLDGSYRADVTGIDVTKPFDLISVGGRVQLFDPGNPNPGPTSTASGCSVTHQPGSSSSAAALLVVGVAAMLLRSRRRRAS